MEYNKIIIADTETAGLGNNDQVIQLALVVVNADTMEIEETYCDLCNPGCTINPKASSIHKKTDDMVSDKPVLTHTDAYKALEKYNVPTNILVFHNAFFDLYMLAKKMFLIQSQLIDTLTSSRHVFKGLSQYKLQTLCNKDGENVVQDHDALSDCMVCLSLLKKLVKETKSLGKLVDYTKDPIIGFGKHKGKKLIELAKKEKSYLEWLINNYDNLDAPMRVIIKALIEPATLDNTEQKGLRYINMHHLLDNK